MLQGVTATLQPGERVGVVGRTGAGKSSLTLALFRLLEPVTGARTRLVNQFGEIIVYLPHRTDQY